MCDKKTLLAVSGGIDSMCMAEIFVRRYPCECLAVAHCNFNLRGEESDGDEALVREWAEACGVRLHVRSFDTKGFARKHGVSIEMAARELRYRWFAELCSCEGYDEVAVAHNANDNAETLILNLLRGSGMKGLSGMSHVSSLPYSDAPDVKLIRPLLDMTRKQIEGFALANRVRYRVDSTNFSSEYKRNMLRNEVFPVFEKINPSVIRTVNREMGYFAEAGDIISDWADEAVSGLCHYDSRSGVRIYYGDLMSRRHWRYLLYHLLEPYGFNSSTLASLEDLLSSGRTISGKCFKSKDHVVLTERESLLVIPRDKMIGKVGVDTGLVTTHMTDDLIMPVRASGTYHFNGRSFKVEILEWSSDMPLKQSDGVLVYDADKLHFPFVLRRWNDGDWFIPFGMRGKKKVSDLFADLKYDSFMKSSAVIIADVRTDGMADCGHVAGVAGVRSDDFYKVTPLTRTVVRITAE